MTFAKSRLEFAANDQHAGSGGDLGFKAHADKRNDDAVMLFEREIGDRAEVVALIQELFGESCPGEEQPWPAHRGWQANRGRYVMKPLPRASDPH